MYHQYCTLIICSNIFQDGCYYDVQGLIQNFHLEGKPEYQQFCVGSGSRLDFFGGSGGQIPPSTPHWYDVSKLELVHASIIFMPMCAVVCLSFYATGVTV